MVFSFIHYYCYLFCFQIVLFWSSGSPSKLDTSFWYVLFILWELPCFLTSAHFLLSLPWNQPFIQRDLIPLKKKNYLCMYVAALGLGAAHGISDLHCGMWHLSCGTLTLTCGMWDLVPWPRIEPRPLPLGAWRFSHWATKEVPRAGSF